MLAFSAIVFALATISTAFGGQLPFQSGNVLVEWTHLPGTQEIEFNLTMKTTGWIGLGISVENSRMKKLDVYAGGFTNSANYLKDYYADAMIMPKQDTTNDAIIISGSENGGITNLRFKRKLDTGDANDTKITPGEKLYLAWAYGTTDRFGYHGSANKGYSGLVMLVAVPASSTIAPTASSSVVATSSVDPVSPTPTSASQDNELMFKNGEYKLNWNFNSNTKEVMFQITVTGTGWIGFGISDFNKDMKDLDIAVAMVNSSGHGTVEDYYSTSKTTPTKDSKQDFTFITASQNNGKTVVEFKRKLKTNDEKDVEIMVGKAYYIAWVFNPTSSVFGYHGSVNRGYSPNKVVLAGTQTTTVVPTTTGTCAKLSSILVLLSMFVAMLGY